jgi:hypothetical protein
VSSAVQGPWSRMTCMWVVDCQTMGGRSSR